MYVLLISPVSQLPTIINEQSTEAAQLFQMGYQPIQYGTKKELELVEIELMENFVSDLEMKALLNQFHDMNIEQLDHAYDISAFFDNFKFLNQSKIAQLTNINASLLRQYSSGNKFPSFKQTQKIEHAIHQLAKELRMVTLISG